MTKGTTSFGKRNVKTHTLCPRCGWRSFHIKNRRCGQCAFPAPRTRHYNWSEKARRRRTTGVGKMKHLRDVNSRFLAGFPEGGIFRKVGRRTPQEVKDARKGLNRDPKIVEAEKARATRRAAERSERRAKLGKLIKVWRDQKAQKKAAGGAASKPAPKKK
eukprot:TRINITY_DN1033_c0_g1_i1.p2 TRINITY_DN1033_c0_g1~~TRINITY_DN1033_c0_g1_i1.p2  ORF type:complete len:160 (+),score=21.14 TRINITY_DN1033_c0_g1_i1:43-522(+)